jgi:hypothetical protein
VYGTEGVSGGVPSAGTRSGRSGEDGRRGRADARAERPVDLHVAAAGADRCDELPGLTSEERETNLRHTRPRRLTPSQDTSFLRQGRAHRLVANWRRCLTLRSLACRFQRACARRSLSLPSHKARRFVPASVVREYALCGTPATPGGRTPEAWARFTFVDRISWTRCRQSRCRLRHRRDRDPNRTLRLAAATRRGRPARPHDSRRLAAARARPEREARHGGPHVTLA